MDTSVRTLYGLTASGALETPGVGTLPMSVDEPSVVAAAIRGDAEAFAQLYDRYVDRVYRHCYYRTASRPDAEDLAQQTFLQAWLAIGRYHERGVPFLAWLLTISDRLAISHHRRRREVPVPVPKFEARQPAAHDPEDALTRGLAADEVRRAVMLLRPERQQVILLRFIDGLSVREVAAALGKSENNVCVIQHRALADLRGHLDAPAGRPAQEAGIVRRVRGAVGRAVRSR